MCLLKTVGFAFLALEITLAVTSGRVQNCFLQRNVGHNLTAILESEPREEVLVEQQY